MKLFSRALAVASTAVALAIAPAAAFAQTAPNLTGDWELDVAASSFGPMSAPQKQLMKVEQAGPSVKTAITSTSERGERTQSAAYATDGTESKNVGPMGNEAVSTAKWDGDALALTTKMSMQGNDITVNDRWSMSDAGKTLTVARTINTPGGAMEMKMVYHKKG